MARSIRQAGGLRRRDLTAERGDRAVRHHQGMADRASSSSGPRLRAAERAAVTYAPVGATLGTLPAGFRHVRRSRVVGSGAACFESASQQVMGWQLHRGAGVGIEPSAPVAATGGTVLVRIGLGPVRLTAPCRVVLVVDEPRRRGFAYGTLPGHPVTGEELFTVALDADDRVRVQIVAFSRPATWWTRLGSPVTSRLQDAITHRYLAAVSGGQGERPDGLVDGRGPARRGCRATAGRCDDTRARRPGRGQATER